MKELTQIRDAVINALEQAGMKAVAVFPEERMKAYTASVAAVGVGAAEGTAMGFCNYLGQAWDEAAGTVRELYGKQLAAVINVDVRAERAAECEAGCQRAAEVLLGGLPSGVRGGELSWRGLEWEKETDMFLRRGELRCRAVFVAESAGDETAFLDFILKGVVEH